MTRSAFTAVGVFRLKSKVLGLLAIALLAGPTQSMAVTSTCTVSASPFTCDFYESGGTVTLNLSTLLGLETVSFGVYGVFEGDPGNIRDILAFSTEQGSAFVTFSFGTFPYVENYTGFVARTGAATTVPLLEGVNYIVHHDSLVPEPGTLALLSLGLLGLGMSRRTA